MEHLWPDGKTRCRWIAPGDVLYCKYHDFEWGVPLHDERALFELLSNEQPNGAPHDRDTAKNECGWLIF